VRPGGSRRRAVCPWRSRRNRASARPL
jgi:hypothetical protein